MTWTLRTPWILTAPDGTEAIFSREATAAEVCAALNALDAACALATIARKALDNDLVSPRLARSMREQLELFAPSPTSRRQAASPAEADDRFDEPHGGHEDYPGTGNKG